MRTSDLQPAYQVRRYGWSAKLPVSIITDFEEFAVCDCTRKPSPTDGAAVSRVRYLTWKDYLAGITLHAAIITNVELMLQLNKDLEAAKLPDRREQLKARIGHTDEKIKRMVYPLYRLTVEKIAIVENFR